MKAKTLVAILVVTCVLLTACGRKELATTEDISVTESITETKDFTVKPRVLTYEDIKDLPTYSGVLKYCYEELYEKYSRNVSLLRKEGESENTPYYYAADECYSYLPDDAACLIQEEYDGYLSIIYKDLDNELKCDQWGISCTVVLPEDLKKLPEEPDWHDPSYIEMVKQHKGNVDLIQNPDIQKPKSHQALYDESHNIITFVDSEHAIFRNGSKLVACSFHGSTMMYRCSYKISDLEEKKNEPSPILKADDSPVFCLAEDGLYYYIIEAGEKKVVKVADITPDDYDYSGIMELENCAFPVFKKIHSPYNLVTYRLQNATVTEEDPWFYTVDKIELIE